MIENLSIVSLFIHILATTGIFFLFWKLVPTFQDKFVLSCLTLGLFVWSIAGAAYPGVPLQYSILLFVYMGVLFSTYLFWQKNLPYFSPSLYLKRNNWIVNNPLFWKSFTFIYLALQLIWLIYPEFRLHLLFNPPRPDISLLAEARFSGEGRRSSGNFLFVIFSYFNLLLGPFFIYSLFYWREKFYIVPLALFLNFYISFVDSGYVPRNRMALALIFLAVLYFFWYPTKRKRFYIVCAISIPIILIFLNLYRGIRQGATFSELLYGQSVFEIIMNLVESEIYYPTVVSMVFEHESPFRGFQYLTWLVTLPIPRFLLPFDATMEINRLYTEFVTGEYFGTDRVSVLLPGLFGEALFLFRPWGFWIHAIVIGSILGVFAYFFKRDPYLISVFLYAIVTEFIGMGRAGSGGRISALINSHLLFVVFCIWANNRLPQIRIPQRRAPQDIPSPNNPLGPKLNPTRQTVDANKEQ